MEIKIEIIKTKRKTIALHLKDKATLIVRAPYGISEEIIENIINKHKNWILRKKIEIQENTPKLIKKEFIDGERFLYLGEYYRLKIVDEQSKPLIFNNGFYLLRSYLPKAKEVFTEWYKQMAFEKISERINLYALMSNLKFNKIRITNAQRRWGSCSVKGNLNFSWYLIMSPIEVIDYVVAHELAHLEIKNHSKIFWLKVKTIMPDYERHKKWLKKEGYTLKI